jgi:hypothetical protein
MQGRHMLIFISSLSSPQKKKKNQKKKKRNSNITRIPEDGQVVRQIYSIYY